MEEDPVITHFRKRKLTESPLSTWEQKIAKCEAVALVSLFIAGFASTDAGLVPIVIHC